MGLTQIITALGSQAVNIGSDPVATSFLSTLKNRYNHSDLPIRIIRAGSGDTSAERIIYMVCNTAELVQVGWDMTDLLLYEPVSHTRGIKDTDPPLVEYMDNYVQMLRTKFLPAGSEIINFSMVFGVYEYPELSRENYHGVEVSLRIREFTI